MAAYTFAHELTPSELSARQDALTQKRLTYAFHVDYGRQTGLRGIQELPTVERAPAAWQTAFGSAAAKGVVNAGFHLGNPSVAQVRNSTDDTRNHKLEDLVYSCPSDANKANCFGEIVASPTLPAPVGSVQEYFDLFADTWPAPRFAGAALFDDAAFARNAVAGPAPLLIARVTPDMLAELPARGFPIPTTGELFREGSPFRGTTVAALAQAGRLYIEDYAMLKTVVGQVSPTVGNKERRFVFAPVVLYALGADGVLLPIAIQCNENGSHGSEPIQIPYIPGAASASTDAAAQSADYSWQMAKTIVSEAHGLYHEIFAHLGRTHLLLECFALAAHRQLGAAHPVFAILKPHLQGLFAIDDLGRKQLINKGGQVERHFAPELASFIEHSARAAREGYLPALYIPNALAARDIDDLPYYPYRDDARAMWGILRAYVERFLGVLYQDELVFARDRDAQAGGELGAFLAELTTTLPLDGSGGSFSSMPGLKLGPIDDRAQLYDLITMLIFTSSAQHAAVNFTQRDYTANPAWMPGAVCRPTPAPGRASHADYLELLPAKPGAIAQMNFFELLGSVQYGQLGVFATGQSADFVDVRIDPAVNALIADLLALEQRIDQRNASLPEPQRYEYLRPSRVPQSTNV